MPLHLVRDGVKLEYLLWSALTEKVRAKNWITAFTQVNKALLDKLLRRYMAFATHALLVFEAAIKGGINGSTKAVLIQGRRTLWKQSVRRK
jgi:hypothetical protein